MIALVNEAKAFTLSLAIVSALGAPNSDKVAHHRAITKLQKSAAETAVNVMLNSVLVAQLAKAK
eukprot:3198149-Pyramimonas_sp.AAC.1